MKHGHKHYKDTNSGQDTDTDTMAHLIISKIE